MADFFKFLFSKDFEDKFNNALDTVLDESDASAEKIIDEIVEHYLPIAMFVASDYAKIKIDTTNFRQIKIDDKFYDLDALISHRQSALYEHLLAIDALFSDLISQGEDLKKCISAIENKLNGK